MDVQKTIEFILEMQANAEVQVAAIREMQNRAEVEMRERQSRAEVETAELRSDLA